MSDEYISVQQAREFADTFYAHDPVARMICRALLDAAPKVDQGERRWIPVTERLPEDDRWVLVCKRELETGMPIIGIDRITLTVGGERMWLNDYTTWKTEVTHWMPLPEPQMEG